MKVSSLNTFQLCDHRRSLHITFQSPPGALYDNWEYTPENCASEDSSEASGEIQGPQEAKTGTRSKLSQMSDSYSKQKTQPKPEPDKHKTFTNGLFPSVPCTLFHICLEQKHRTR